MHDEMAVRWKGGAVPQQLVEHSKSERGSWGNKAVRARNFVHVFQHAIDLTSLSYFCWGLFISENIRYTR